MNFKPLPSKLWLLWRPGSGYLGYAGFAGLLLLAMVLLPPVRRATEASMTTHMLVQYPALLLAGALLVGPLPRRWMEGVKRGGLQRWNELGIAGLLVTALTMALLMVPRVLDLALVDLRVESVKLLALVASGAALMLSWQRAGTVLQAFFLGNVLAVVGTLYQDSTTRVCNAYRLDDQQTLGVALVWVAAGVLVIWLLRLGADAVAGGSQASRTLAAVTVLRCLHCSSSGTPDRGDCAAAPVSSLAGRIARDDP